MTRHTIKNIQGYLKNRSKLDLFLIKGGGLVLVYYLTRIAFKFTPFLKPVFLFARKLLTQILLLVSKFILDVFGYDVQTYKKIIWIEGSQGVKIINACLGWSMMALFMGFVLIYPGQKKQKYWFIPLGLIVLQIANVLRIVSMALVSYHRYEMLDFYHKYVFNFFLYLVCFILWIIWVKKFGDRD